MVWRNRPTHDVLSAKRGGISGASAQECCGALRGAEMKLSRCGEGTSVALAKRQPRAVPTAFLQALSLLLTRPVTHCVMERRLLIVQKCTQRFGMLPEATDTVKVALRDTNLSRSEEKRNASLFHNRK